MGGGGAMMMMRAATDPQKEGWWGVAQYNYGHRLKAKPPPGIWEGQGEERNAKPVFPEFLERRNRWGENCKLQIPNFGRTATAQRELKPHVKFLARSYKSEFSKNSNLFFSPNSPTKNNDKKVFLVCHIPLGGPDFFNGFISLLLFCPVMLL